MTPSDQSVALIKWSKPGLIYVARNLVSGKIYVGQTIRRDVSGRKREHLKAARQGSDCPFHRAIMKYGLDAFEFTIVQKCNNYELLDEAERWWIENLSSMIPTGYNARGGGHIGRRSQASDETRKKISAKLKGMKHSKEWAEKTANALRGRHWSEEEKSRAKGRKRPPELMVRIGAVQRGVPKPSLIGNHHNRTYWEKVKSDRNKDQLSLNM